MPKNTPAPETRPVHSRGCIVGRPCSIRVPNIGDIPCHATELLLNHYAILGWMRSALHEGALVSERDAFGRILDALHEAAFEPAQWSRAAALIEESLGVHGSSLACGEGESDN